MPRPPRSLIPVVMIGALAFALAACGRKGPLDPPPGGYAVEPGTSRTAVTNRGSQRDDQKAAPEYDDEGRPIASAGRKKKLPGDWLLD